MNIRPITEADYGCLAEWFADTPWPLPPVKNLIPSKNGFIAEFEGVPVACGFLYITGTSVAELSWTNTNPYTSLELQRDGMDAIITAIKEAIKKVVPKVSLVASYVKNEAFAEQLKKHGFRIAPNYFRCTWVSNDYQEA